MIKSSLKIIGRTDFKAEENSNKNLLTKEKYYFISHLARDFIIKNSIKSLPVNLNDIIKKNNWKTISYSKLKTIEDCEYDDLMNKNLGFAIYSPVGYFICYDDSQSFEIQRFTIAHEIGHIVLNHFLVPEENREQEANMFAVRLLMPISVLHECKVESAQEIKKLCFVSEMSAGYRWERLEMLVSRHKFYTDKNEVEVYKNFKKFINSYNEKNSFEDKKIKQNVRAS